MLSSLPLKKPADITTFLYLTFFLPVLLATPLIGHATVTPGISFSWKGNQESTVTGYRLYYGEQSRQNATSTSEAYEFYIDLETNERCATNPYRPACEAIRTDQLRCSNLESTNPDCTILGLTGGYHYFAVTAYSLNQESGYSVEVKALLDSNGNDISYNSSKSSHLPAVYQLLLSPQK